MALKDMFGLVSLILSVVSYVPYVRSIFVANTKPHAFTWLVSGTVMAIAFVAQLSDSAGAGSWATGLSGAFCLGIGIVALFRGEKHITRGDWMALEHYTLVTSVYQFVSILMEIGIVVMLLWRRSVLGADTKPGRM